MNMKCDLRRSAMKECTQDGQGGTEPLEAQGCTDPVDKDELAPAALKECAQEGQGGSGPQETQGRTISYIVG